MFRRQPVVDGYHQRAGAHRVAAGVAVVGVQVAYHPAAAVEEQHHRRLRGRVGWPVQPDRYRTRRRVDYSVLDAQFLVDLLARQVAEPLPGGSGPPSVVNWNGTASSTFCRMASTAGLSAEAGMATPYAPKRMRTLWLAAAAAGAGYGIFLIVTALRLPSGAELTGQFVLQPTVKALAAVLLAIAALSHPIARERHWLLGALSFSAAGDVLLALPWWTPSFVLGLGAFLIAHLCFLAALIPLVTRSAPRMAAAVVLACVCVALLVWFWPRLAAEGMTVPVTLYIAVLGAMVCAALLARLPTIWTALGAVCFALSDGMIGIGRFVLGSEVLAVPIWWAYATSLLLITAGFFFGRGRALSAGASDRSVTPAA